MLRRQFLAAAAAVGLAFTVSASAAPVEGKDYVVLEKPIVNAENTFIKVYSYDCPFCYRYDKGVVPILKEKLGKELTFKDYHLHTKGKYGNQGADVLAVLWVEDEAAGRDPTDEGSLAK